MARLWVIFLPVIRPHGFSDPVELIPGQELVDKLFLFLFMPVHNRAGDFFQFVTLVSIRQLGERIQPIADVALRDFDSLLDGTTLSDGIYQRSKFRFGQPLTVDQPT